MNEPDSRPKAAAYVPWVPLVTTGLIATIIAFFRADVNGTWIALGIIGLFIAIAGILGMVRVWRRHH